MMQNEYVLLHYIEIVVLWMSMFENVYYKYLLWGSPLRVGLCNEVKTVLVK